MNETHINRTIGKSLDWYFKIPDNAFLNKLPFDGFGVYKGYSIYWEAKYLNKPSAFNFSRLEDHQIQNLLEISKQNSEYIIPLLLIAVNFGRSDTRIYYYKDIKEIAKRKQNKESILKKEFESSKNYIKIKKSLINIDEIIGEM